MQKLFRSIFLIFIFITVSVYAFPQQVSKTIKVSREKVFIKGKKYFIHTIEKGQTLYSIAKTYGVSQKDIALENPGIYAGIKSGQSLLIPYTVTTEDIGKKEPDTANFIFHTIKTGQTLYSLSKKYEITIDEILINNPGLTGNNLHLGDLLKIPVKKNITEEKSVNTEDEDFIYHKVLSRKETIFYLSKKYNVSIRTIKNANPDMGWGLDVNKTYKIPKKKK